MKTLAVAAALSMSVLAGPCWAFEISSPAVGSDGTIPLRYTANRSGCSGQDISLPLAWKGVPAGAKSLAITMFDRDAGHGRGFWHWLVVDLPPTMTHLAAGAGDPGNTGLPKGTVQALDDAGVSGYFGPCPPPGDPPHHYVITIFAVKTAGLPADAQTRGAVVASELRPETIAEASVTYTYGR